jgi:hypothetical protein
MTDRNKFEEMLERLVNEDRAGAEELFHEIVVEKSREIYQSIIESEEDEEVDEAAEEDDEELDEAAEEDDEEVDEAAEEDDEELDEMFGLEDFAPEADNNPMGMGGDADDDMLGDIGMDGDDMGDMDGEGDVDNRLADLEDALEELKAEFDALMSGEEGDEEGDDMGDMDDEEGDDMGDMDDEEGDDEEKDSFAFESKKDDKKDDKKKKSAGEEMREYVEKVGGAQYNQYGKMGDNGANTKSIVAKPNNMGGTTANLRGGESNSEGTQGGLLNPAKKDMSTGNINVPGGKAGKTAFKKSEPGHGAEKKGAGETADKSAGSMLNGAPKRAK